MPRSFSRRDMLRQIDFDAYLRSIANISPQLNLQEIGGLVALAWNLRVLAGRELVINGDFANWTADDPDGWTVTEVGDATSNVTENPAGECQIISDGTLTFIGQTILEVGKSYEISIEITANSLGALTVGGFGDYGLSVIGTDTRTLTAISTGASIRRAGACNVTIDNVTIKQKNILASSVYPGAEEALLNGNFADWTGDYPDNWEHSTDGANSEISEVGITEGHGGVGTGACNIWTDNSTLTFIKQNFSLTVGIRYIVEFDALVTSGTVQVKDYGDTTLYQTIISGNNSAEFTALDAGLLIKRGGNCDVTLTNIVVRPANPLNGDDTATTVGVATGLASMPYARTFDGATSYIDITSAEYNSILDPATFSAYIFAKPSWDANERDFFSHTIDANNYIRVGQSATAGTARWEIMADGNLNSRTLATGAPDIFSLFGISCEGGVMKAIYNGVQVGADIALVGTVIGNFLTMIIGARNDTPTNVVDGDMMQYDSANRALTSVEWSDIDQRSGI